MARNSYQSLPSGECFVQQGDNTRTSLGSPKSGFQLQEGLGPSWDTLYVLVDNRDLLNQRVVEISKQLGRRHLVGGSLLLVGRQSELPWCFVKANRRSTHHFSQGLHFVPFILYLFWSPGFSPKKQAQRLKLLKLLVSKSNNDEMSSSNAAAPAPWTFFGSKQCRLRKHLEGGFKNDGNNWKMNGS